MDARKKVSKNMLTTARTNLTGHRKGKLSFLKHHATQMQIPTERYSMPTNTACTGHAVGATGWERSLTLLTVKDDLVEGETLDRHRPLDF